MSESEIPDDLRAKAIDAILRGNGSVRCGGSLHLAIAEALLSERRQCADIAYGAALYSGCPAEFIAEEIAETVRNGRRQPMRPSR